jgi:hypothetical protein
MRASKGQASEEIHLIGESRLHLVARRGTNVWDVHGAERGRVHSAHLGSRWFRADDKVDIVCLAQVAVPVNCR